MNLVQNYYDALPVQIPEKAVRSFLFSFATGTICSGGNPLVGVTCGALGMTSSIIDSLVRPIFNRFMLEDSFFAMLTKNVVVVCLLNLIITAADPYVQGLTIANVVGSAFFSFLCWILTNRNGQHPNMAADYVVVHILPFPAPPPF